MDMTKLTKVTAGQIRKNLPEFREGDKVKVHFRIKEGQKERIQIFEGLVLKTQGSGVSEVFVVRKISNGVGVERTFPKHSPLIAKIEVVAEGIVRRARLYYMRDRIGKAATKVKTKRLKKKVKTAK